MAAGPVIVPDKAKLNFLSATNLLNPANTFKMSLHAAAFTPNDLTNEVYADLASELATANGYTAGGIALAGVALTLIPAQIISSITRAAQVATLTTAAPHGLSTGAQVTIKDAVDVLYNGTFAITVTGASTFTYAMTGTPAANASVVGTYGGVVKFTFAAPVWTAAGGSIPAWRHAYIRAVGTLNGKVDPIVGHFFGDSTPADVPATTVGNTLTITPSASGIMTAT